MQTSGHNNSQLRFLIWVAYTRKYDPNVDETQRRTCPLIGCEQRFYDPEIMLQHVQTCARLSSGLYRCTFCYHPQKIGKHFNHTCRPLQQPKPRLSSIVNHLRFAKRLFSHRTERNNPPFNEPEMAEVTPRRLDELSSLCELPCNSACATELEVPEALFNPWPYRSELATVEERGELAVDGNFMSYSTTNLQNGPFEFPTNEEIPNGFGAHSFSSDASLAELGTGFHTTISERSPDIQRERDSPSCTAAQQCDGKSTYIPTINVTSPILEPSFSNLRSHMDRIARARKQARYSNLPSLDIPPPESHHSRDDTTMVSPLEGQKSPLSMTRYSTVSSLSSSPTLDTTMSSFDFGDTKSPHQIESSGSLFFDNGPQIIYTEPESMDFDSSIGELEAEFGICKDAKDLHTEAELDLGILDGILDLSDNATPNDDNSPSQSTEVSTYQDTFTTPEIGSPSPPLPAWMPSPETSLKAGPRYQCKCGYEPQGKKVNKASNLKRHQKTCRHLISTPYAGIYRKKPHRCSVCGNRFTRSDNLLEHRRRQKHLGNMELALKYASPELISGYDLISKFQERGDSLGSLDAERMQSWRVDQMRTSSKRGTIDKEKRWLWCICSALETNRRTVVEQLRRTGAFCLALISSLCWIWYIMWIWY